MQAGSSRSPASRSRTDPPTSARACSPGDDTHPSVPTFQFCLGRAHNTIGVLHSRTGKPAEALEAYRTALPIQTKVVEANPGNSDYQGLLANLHNNIGLSLGHQRQFAEAFVAFDAGLGLRLKLLETDPQDSAKRPRSRTGRRSAR